MTDRVMVALRVDASPQRAFQVFTEEIGLWWRPNPMFAATPRSPGRMAFETGPEGRLVEILDNGKVFEIGKITAWEPGIRLAFGWRFATFAPGMDGAVEVLFDAVGAQTRVTVIHSGWRRVPADHVARHGMPEVLFQRHFGAWWQVLLHGMARLAAVPP
jgi:uncharacterized protein YndB with AHSA1/START domain